MRYFLFGKQIQRTIEMAEDLGRELASNGFKEELLKRDTLIKNMRREIEERAFTKLCEMTYSVDPKNVITAISDRAGNAAIIKLGDEELTLQEIKNLKEEVKWYRQSKLYHININTLKNKAQEVMFKKSESFEDMRSGKMCLINIDIQENILKAIDTFDTKKK